MKAFNILVGALLFVSASAYAADKQTVKVPVTQQNPQTQTQQPKNPGYTWQDCVDDYTKESGFSQEDAYKQCDKLQ